MKKLLLFSLLTIIFASCSYVEPNYEGVLMENYGKAGKADFSLQTGKVWTASWGTELYQVPMFEQKGDCPELKVFSKDGGEYTVDPSYTYAPTRGKGVDIIFAYKQLYGNPETFFDNIEGSVLNTRVLNAYRDEARNYSTDSLMNNVASYEASVQKRLATEFEKKCFTIEEITSNLILPESMRKAVEARNNQIQEANKIENAKKTRINQIEIDVLDAQTKVKIAALETEANLKHSQGLTSEILRERWIDKWDGKLPNTVAGNGTDLIIQK